MRLLCYSLIAVIIMLGLSRIPCSSISEDLNTCEQAATISKS
jgi:hypothetical protein